MISNRADYDFVLIADGLKVDGGIYPLRLNKKELRAEDPAFLLEAMNQRYSVLGIDPTTEYVDRRIVGSRLARVRDSLRSLIGTATVAGSWNYAIDPDYEFDDGLYDAGSLTGTYTVPTVIIPALMLSLSDLRTSENAFVQDSPLNEYDLECLFSDSQKVRRFQIYDCVGSLFNQSAAFKINDTFYGGSSSTRTATGFYEKSGTMWFDSGVDYASTREITIDQQYLYSNPLSNIQKKYVAKVYVMVRIFAIGYRYYKYIMSSSYWRMSQDSSTQRFAYYYAFVEAELMNDSRIRISTAELQKYIPQIVSDLDMSIGCATESQCGILNVSTESRHIIVDIGNHAFLDAQN